MPQCLPRLAAGDADAAAKAAHPLKSSSTNISASTGRDGRDRRVIAVSRCLSDAQRYVEDMNTSTHWSAECIEGQRPANGYAG
ncbi:MAG: hypothetical protein JF606_13380 [Burkholderiales bacterium]|nr:hypothetical protein [Burkholderiales bacterium]